MADAYTRINGKLVTWWMAWQIARMDAAFFAVFGVHLIVADAIRTYADQERIFRSRYVTASAVRGRRVYDTRMWNGVRWYRISSAGTVAVPGSSNHEIQGSFAAVDFWDTGNDPGVSSAGTARSNWLRANAHRFDFEPEGFNFGEAWHYRARNIFNTPPAGGGGSTTRVLEEDDMIAARITDRQGVKHHALIGNGHFRHLLGSDDPEWQKNIHTAEDRWVDMNLDQLPSVLRSNACDLNIWDIRNGTLVVRDPLTGKVGPGFLWSADNEIRAALAKLAAKS